MAALLISPETLPMCSIYILVQLPYVQDLMQQQWFRSECILYKAADEQEQLPSAYFIPMERFAQAINEGLIVLHV